MSNLFQDVPDDLKGKDSTKGEASLRGHLKNGEDEDSGSQAYVPPDSAKDKALGVARDILRGSVTVASLKQKLAEEKKQAEEEAKKKLAADKAKSEPAKKDEPKK